MLGFQENQSFFACFVKELSIIFMYAARDLLREKIRGEGWEPITKIYEIVC